MRAPVLCFYPAPGLPFYDARVQVKLAQFIALVFLLVVLAAWLALAS